ncbi:hypothetical protein scyTo_0026237, partial [Scyliorhinus torazame]|nr:hypothetical protein [Scyliorhinus torazame]
MIIIHVVRSVVHDYYRRGVERGPRLLSTWCVAWSEITIHVVWSVVQDYYPRGEERGP